MEFIKRIILFFFIGLLFFLMMYIFLGKNLFNLDKTNITNENVFNFLKEGLTNNSVSDTSIIINSTDAFCESHRGSSYLLEKSCNKLTKNNCNSTSCCVWTNNDKCVAGNSNGPTFNTDDNGKTQNLDYYYYQNKCYGTKCSN
jgi:hypothetical protein